MLLSILATAGTQQALTGDLPIGQILMGLLGGLALFLFGMEQMTESLKLVAGDGMRKLLATLTKNRWSAALTGAFVTAVIQSSSVTTVLVVGFVSAGLMTLGQSVGVIMGANVGTTITAQIIAFKVTKYALALISAGFLMQFIGQRESVRNWGGMIMGLGLIFFGMGLMSDGTTPLRSYEPFINVMKSMGNPALGILGGAIFTALVQSSSATTGIVIVLASQGFISLGAGIALAFGANIGTCVTALLASLGKPRTALRAATIHVFFNVTGVLLWLPLIDWLASFITTISPSRPELADAARLAAETPRQIANAHTVFNLINTLVFLPFTTVIARLVQRWVPDKPIVISERARPKYLQEVFLETPALSMDPIRMELCRLGKHVQEFSVLTLEAVRGGSDMKPVDTMRSEIEQLYEEILRFLQRLAQVDVGAEISRKIQTMTAIATDLEHVSEIFATNVVALGDERRRASLPVVQDANEMISSLHLKIQASFDSVLDALEAADADKARSVVDHKPEIQATSQSIQNKLVRMVDVSDPQSLTAYRWHSQVIELLKRHYYFSKKIAKEIVKAAELENEPDEKEKRVPEPLGADL